MNGSYFLINIYRQTLRSSIHNHKKGFTSRAAPAHHLKLSLQNKTKERKVVGSAHPRGQNYCLRFPVVAGPRTISISISTTHSLCLHAFRPFSPFLLQLICPTLFIGFFILLLPVLNKNNFKNFKKTILTQLIITSHM